MRNILKFSVFLTMMSSIGCGKSGAKVHTVAGQVRFEGGDGSLLTGHSVEIVRVDDPNTLAAGTISADGRFTLDSVRDGKVLAGAPEGNYRARIVLSDDDPEAMKRAQKALPAEVQQFRPSEWNITVPTAGRVELTIPAKAR